MARTSLMESPFGGSPHVFFATTSYSGALAGVASYSWDLLVPELVKAGIKFSRYLHNEDCHVDDARNACVREFLKSDADVLFFLDADVGFTPDTAIALIRSEREVIGCSYRKKSTEEEYAIKLPAGVWQAEADGALLAEGLPTGFLAIKRQVIEVLAAEVPKFKGQRHKEGDALYPQIFARRFIGGTERLSGDFSFCWIWRKRGGQVYVYPEATLVHEGTQEFVGCFGDALRRSAGIEHPGFRPAYEELRNGNTSDLVMQTLFGAWGNRYAGTAEFQLALYLLAKEAKGPIFEAGSGLSTLVLAAAAPDCEIHALEHDPQYLVTTRNAIARHGVKNVRLHYAPLQEFGDFWWYSVPPMPMKFSLAVCDGPQGVYGREGFYRIMSARLHDAVVVADDIHRELEHSPVLGGFLEKRELEVLGEERGFGVMRPKAA